MDFGDEIPGGPVRKWPLYMVVAFCALGFWLYWGTKPSDSSISAERVCARNMHDIGVALSAYADANHQQFPADLIAVQDKVPDETYRCPRGLANFTEVPGTRPAELRSDYIYWGDGLQAGGTSPGVLLTENISNHVDGLNVLYADGRVEFVPEAAAQRLLGSLKIGVNPPVPAIRGTSY